MAQSPAEIIRGALAVPPSRIMADPELLPVKVAPMASFPAVVPALGFALTTLKNAP